MTDNVGRVMVPHHSRKDGRSNYTVRKLLSLFLTVLTGYSVLPLRVLTGIGAALLGFSLWFGIALLVGHLTRWLEVREWELAFWVGTMLGGLQLLFVGILGEYVGRLSMTQSGMPPYVVKRTWGLDKVRKA